ncbi:MAG: molybdenum cofactor guanylyltransferase [Nitrospirae bacterium]|nr:molybdenum cofactor guanylyltransferase [Nitrospirota bacterium]
MDALILAGGENNRFLSHKALAEVRGKRIIETTIELFKKYFNKITISTNTPELFFYLGLPMIGDLMLQKGPMTGIYSSLVSTGAPELFVAACDMPFIQAGVLELIMRHYEGQDAVVPVFEGRPQPLFGIYSASVRDAMKLHIMQNRKALRDLLQDIHPALIPEEEVRAADPEGRTFININTLEEYRNLVIHI